MSLIPYVDVVCDECLERYDDGDVVGRTVRASAKQDGWAVALPGGRDLCTDCRPTRT